MKKIVYYILFIILATISFSLCASDQEAKEKLNVSELIFEHTGDAYEWHIVTIGHKHVSIYLPVIVYSKHSGVNIFISSKLNHNSQYNNFKIADETSKYKGKVIEVLEDGSEYRPFDISITKNVFSLIISISLLMIIVLSISIWYKRRDGYEVPRGFMGAVDLFILDINDNLIKSCIGENYKKFAPYLLTAFFFILLNNLMGLIPIFPGGANLTGNIAITFTLAMLTFLIVNISGTKEYWKEILWPPVPIWLKVPAPMMPLIELFGIFTKPFALMIRLFANILAGHSLILGLCCIIFLTADMGAGLSSTLSGISVFFMIFMNLLELLVSYVQAYVFTMLSAVFIGLAQVKHQH